MIYQEPKLTDADEHVLKLIAEQRDKLFDGSGPIPRGQDLTDDDIALIVEDFYVVRNWAALSVHLSVSDMKEQLRRTLRARLGRMEGQ